MNISTTSRRHASAAAAVAEQPAASENEASVSQATSPAIASGPRKAFRLLCSPVVSRPPILTRELTSFEKAFFLYQKRLNERLALPFTRYFYYKKDTPADVQWKRQARARKGTAARDVGVYNAYDEEGWNDEVLVGSRLSEPSDVVDKLIRDAEGKDIVDAQPQGDAEAGGQAVSGNSAVGEGTRKPVGEVNVERPLARTTKDDAEGNKQSLNRKLDRSLYLLVKNKEGSWRFPQDRVLGRESLHQVCCSSQSILRSLSNICAQATERILLQAGGINMNTWVVGNHPIGHYAAKFAKPILSKILGNRLISTSKEDLHRKNTIADRMGIVLHRKVWVL